MLSKDKDYSPEELMHFYDTRDTLSEQDLEALKYLLIFKPFIDVGALEALREAIKKEAGKPSEG